MVFAGGQGDMVWVACLEHTTVRDGDGVFNRTVMRSFKNRLSSGPGQVAQLFGASSCTTKGLWV